MLIFYYRLNMNREVFHLKILNLDIFRNQLEQQWVASNF